MVTHNANLVVNTDAELVILAESKSQGAGRLPKFTYRWGALKSQDVGGWPMRHQICRIMEGGAAAFQMRERRYMLETDAPNE